ncbi:YjdJ family protein [Thalassobacillus hwangdonensis]|uniref:YjdJ family protein n=1 Tax=Thalassobacillus hwangdonensis TaxID=546108 RepID=A0ABW3L132_9BACI
MKYIIQYIVASLLLMFSTLVAWFEGSAIRQDPWEWKYTAFFSEKLNGEVTNATDLSQLDHFIYAAKFTPVYPILMIVSLAYIITLSGFVLLNKQKKIMIYFHLALGLLFILLALVVADSPTTGGKYLMSTFLFMGVILVFLAVFFFVKKSAVE